MMKVKLVGYTQPSEDFKDKFSDIKDLVAFCARVSNPSNQFNTKTSEKLIAYLIKNKHWSPLEMASVTVEVETTRDIARQILRHRSFSFQEFSQRYADPTQDLAFELRDARLQDLKNRQNSIITNDKELDLEWKMRQQKILDLVIDNYSWAIDKGIAKEQARAILPEGLTRSRMYISGTIRSYIHYIEVRTENGVQLEHKELAQCISEAISKIFTYEKPDPFCSVM